MSGLTSTELRDLTLSVGTHRSDRRLSPLEVAQLIDKMLRSEPSREKCSQRLGISRTQISSFLKILVLDSRIRHLADWRRSTNASIPFSTLSEIARLDFQEQVELAEAILRHELRWKEVVQIVQIRERSREVLDVCIDRVLALRKSVEIQHLFVGRITSSFDGSHLRTLSQAERDESLQRVLNRLLGAQYRRRSRLSEENFTIVSDHDLPRLLGLTPDELEEAINFSLTSSDEQ